MTKEGYERRQAICKQIAGQLQRFSGQETEVRPLIEPYDILVGPVRVGVRVATPGQYRRVITIAGRVYRYRYRAWHFNFHRHGVFNSAAQDWFVCVALEYPAPGQVTYFTIPSSAITGKTFSLHGGGKEYRGRYQQYRGREYLRRAFAAAQHK